NPTRNPRSRLERSTHSRARASLLRREHTRPATSTTHRHRPDEARQRALRTIRISTRIVLRFGSYEELFGALRRGDVDASWMSPVAYVRAEEEKLAHASASIVRGASAGYGSG